MADLDKDLELKIAANATQATEAIDGLIDKLIKLNQSLSLGNLERFSSQLKDIASAANSLSGISKDINAISSAGSKLASLTGFKTLNDQMQEVEAESRRLAKAVSDYFSFDKAKNGKRNIEELGNYIASTMRNAAKTGNTNVIREQAELMGDIIAESSVTVQDIQAEAAAYADLADWVKKTTIYLDDKTKANLKHADSLNAIKAAFKGITSDPTKGTSLDTFLMEVEKFGVGGGHPEEAITAIARAVNEYNHAVKSAVVQGRAQITTGLVSEKDFQEAGRSLASNVEKSFGKIFSEEGTKKDLFGSLLPSLTELSGITIPDFSGLNVLADALTKLQHVNAKKIQSIVSALHGLNVNINTSGLEGAVQSAQNMGDAAPKIKETADAMNNMAEGLKEVGENASSAINTGEIEQTTSAVKDLASAAQDAGDSISQTKDDTVGLAFEQMRSKVDGLGRAFQQARNGFKGVTGDLQDVGTTAPKIQETADAMNHMAEGLSEVGKDASSAVNVGELEKGTKELENVAEGFGKVKDAVAQSAGKGDGSSALAQEMQRISEKIKEVKSQMYELNDIQGSDGSVEYKSLEVRLQMLTDRYNALNEIGKKNQSVVADQKSRNIDLLASLVALGHELQTVASTFDKWGDAGIRLVKMVFSPLRHEFEEFKSRISGISNAMKNLRNTMQKHLDKMSAFWKRAMKTFTFMLVRKAITAILNETKNAIDSLAAWSNTFGTQFNSSMSEIVADATYLARSLIAIFEPIINAIVPILNTLVNALGRAARALAEFFAAFTGQNYFMVAKKQVGNYADSLNKANKAQKNLTMGIDELNILSENNSGGANGGAGGLGDGWDTAPVSDKMRKFADDIKKILDQIFEPFKKAWDKAKDHVISGFNYMKNQLKYLAQSIGRDFLKMWNEDATVDMLTNILLIVGDIMTVIGNIARKFREAWDSGNTGLHILENIRDIFAILIAHVRDVTKYMMLWSAALDFEPLLDSVELLTEKLKKVAAFVGNVFEDVMKNVVLKYINYMITEGIPHLFNTIGEIIDAFDFVKLRHQLVPLEKAFEGMLENIHEGITNAIGNIGKAVGAFTQSEEFQKFLDAIQWFMEQVTAERVEKLFTALGTAILDVAKSVMGFVSSDTFKDFIQMLLDWYDSKTPEDIAKILENIAKAILLFKFTGFVGKGVSGFASFLSVLASAKNVVGILSGLGSAGSAAGTGIAAAGAGGTAAAGGLGAFVAAVAPVAAAIAGITLAVKSFVDSFGGVGGAVERLKKLFGDISGYLKGVAEDLNLAGVIQRLKDAFSGLFSSLGNMKDFWEVILKVFEVVVDAIGTALIPIIELLAKALGVIVVTVKGVIENLGALGEIIVGVFTLNFDKVIEGVERFVNSFIGWFKDLKYQLIGDPIVYDIVDGVIGGFTDMVTSVINAVKGFVTKIVNFFKKLWSDAVAYVTKLKDDTIAKWEETKASVEEKVRLLKESIIQKWQEIKTSVEEKVRLLKESIIQKWQETKTNVEEKVRLLKESIIQKWQEVKTNVEEKVRLLKESIIQKWQETKDSVEEKVRLLKEELIKKWEQMKKDATELLEKVKDAITKPFKDAYDALFGEDGWITKLVKKFKKGLEDLSPEKITEALKGVADAIVAPFKEAYEAAMGDNGWVKQLLNGIKEFFNGIKTAIDESPLGQFFKNITDKINSLKDALKGLKNDAKEAERETANSSSASNYFNGGFVQYATGGYPSRGTLFWAGEYGLPEMLGTVGGKTAVASSAEITGIRESVMESSIAEQNMMGQMINLLQTIALKDTSVNLDSRELVSSLNDRARRNGYNFRAATT